MSYDPHSAPSMADILAAMATPRDWPEDSPLENGNYMCKCIACKQIFTGHKGRVVCKLCSKPK